MNQTKTYTATVVPKTGEALDVTAVHCVVCLTVIDDRDSAHC